MLWETVMLVVKGKFDGKRLRLDKPVRIDHEVPVIVTFPDVPAEGDFRDFLLAGPTIPQEGLDTLLEFIEGFRRWKT